MVLSHDPDLPGLILITFKLRIMKNYFIIALMGQSTFAQVAIGKNSITNTSVSLEFGSENRGLILPYIPDKKAINTNGTLLFDTSDYKVKYLKNGSWTNLSEDDGTADTIGTADLSIQGSDKAEQSLAKTVIGIDGSTNSTPGILVLSNTNKAMILPKVASPHLNIISPASGMIVYDTDARQVAVYNGKSWSFWKP